MLLDKYLKFKFISLVGDVEAFLISSIQAHPSTCDAETDKHFMSLYHIFVDELTYNEGCVLTFFFLCSDGCKEGH